MSSYIKKFHLTPKQKPLQPIDNIEETSTGNKSVCTECEHCLIFDGDIYYCTAGSVTRISQNPITGLEGRIFQPLDENIFPYHFSIDELPFPMCSAFNEDGNCEMYSLGSPTKIECSDEPDTNIAVELDAYLRAYEKQKK
ncbi:MAG: hypothetical protein ACLFPL_03550 [Candidatus Nanoarchaeia archaeon]